MNSRIRILQAIRQAAIAPLPQPEIARFENPADWATFATAAQIAGAKVVQDGSLAEACQRLQLHTGKRILNAVPDLANFGETPDPQLDPHTLADVEAVLLKGRFGVAENGAVWLRENDLVVRALPFICRHLYILLEISAILPDMHAAYAHIDQENPNFGLFICGPSKTADIEQSLVIGAHGALSATIIGIGDWGFRIGD